MLLQTGLNGARPPGAHRSLPLTPEEQAASAVECVVAGASVWRLASATRAPPSASSIPGLAGECLRVLLEPQPEELSLALGIVDRLEAELDRSGVRCPRLLHGTAATAWPLLDEAARLGYDARIGLEDTLMLPNSRPEVS